MNELPDDEPDDVGGCAAIVVSACVGLGVMLMAVGVIRWLMC